jgi:hypothetical protein
VVEPYSARRSRNRKRPIDKLGFPCFNSTISGFALIETDVSRLAAFVKWCLSCTRLEGFRGTNGVADSVSNAFIVEDLPGEQQLPPGVDPPHPMSVPFIQGLYSTIRRCCGSTGISCLAIVTVDTRARTAARRQLEDALLLVLPPDRANGGACIAWGGRPSDVRHVIFALGGAL